MMGTEVTALLREAVNAPSGHNAQPWRIHVGDETVEVFLDEDADTTLYNYQQRGSYIGIGALIENIKQLSPCYDLEAKISLFPKKGNTSLVAQIRFVQQNNGKCSRESIIKRATNRKPYKKVSPASGVVENLQNLLLPEEVYHKITINRSDITAIAKAVSVNERLLFENKAMHQAVFPHILWSKQEEKQTKKGLYIKTLELPPPVQILFRFWRSWSVAKFFGILGFGKIVARQNSSLYRTASFYASFIIKDHTPSTYVALGQALQRFWIELTALGFVAQPTVGILYLSAQISEGKNHPFPKSQSALVTQSMERIRKALSLDHDEYPAMLLRCGVAKPVSAQSLKNQGKIQ